MQGNVLVFVKESKNSRLERHMGEGEIHGSLPLNVMTIMEKRFSDKKIPLRF
jgi:hypothetical protein